MIGLVIYASCPDVCPPQSEKLAKIQEDINDPPRRNLVRFVAVTTDPVGDTANVLKEYGPAHGLDPADWIFLTSGTDHPAATRELARRYGLEFTEEAGGEQMHGVVTHLIDKSGNLRARYHGLKLNATTSSCTSMPLPTTRIGPSGVARFVRGLQGREALRMLIKILAVGALVALSPWWAPVGALAAGNPAAGAQDFSACTACHSLRPGRHMTGPSLAGVYGRPAGTAEGFTRYSPALRAAGVTWSDETLDAWLADPRAFIPGNRMTFPGIKEARARADLIAFLKHPTSAKASSPASRAE